MNYCKKQKKKYHNYGGKEKLLNIIWQITMLQRKRQVINKRIWQKNKKVQKENIQRIGMKN